MELLTTVSSVDATGAAPPAFDDVTAELSWMVRGLGELADIDGGGDGGVADGVRVDRIAVLEQVKAAAAEAAEMVLFARSQVEAQRHSGVDYRRLGRGIGDQIGLACTVSPAAGSRRLALARAWCVDLPARYGLLRAGQVSEWVATVVARETSHLDGPTRRLAYAVDPAAAVARARTEEGQRRVTVRPAPGQHGDPDRVSAGGAGHRGLGRAAAGR
ncbi:MAG: hypothetical protein AVDCRST_MAG75-1962, partial [uncultured Propionibacteriaceae bacterium]